MESTVGENGGSISKNMLEINITPEDHGAIIICEAINDELQESTHNAQTLSVKCKNFFRKIILVRDNIKRNSKY